MGPIGAARVGYVDGQYVLNPTAEQLTNSALDLVVAGTAEGVLMVESEAKELSEEVMLGAVNFGATEYQHVINAIIDLAEQCAKEPWPLAEENPEKKAVWAELQKFSDDLRGAYAEQAKQARTDKIDDVKKKAKEAIGGDDQAKTDLVGKLFKDLERDIVRGDIVKTGKRIDGRDGKTVRPISAEVGVLPRAHGSALFTRGETQALAVATLGTGQDEQIIDALEGEFRADLHAALQLPAVLDRRGGPHGLARPARDRPRQAGLARDPSDDAGKGSVPLHHPHRVGDHRVQRLVLDGDGVRHLAQHDGCGRAAEASGRGHRHGPDQGALGLRGASATSSATRITSATWTSRSPAPTRASPPCRWTSRSPRSRRRS